VNRHPPITLRPGMALHGHFTLRAEAPAENGALSFDPSPISMIEAAEGGAQAVKAFEMTAYTGGAMEAGFGDPIVVDLEGVDLHTPNPPILRDHDRGQVLGHAELVEVSAQRIKVRGLLSGANDPTREVVESARNGFPWCASIAGKFRVLEFVNPGETVKANGRSFTGPVYIARKFTITEISVVAIPADGKARTKVAASASEDKEHPMTFSQWLASKNKVEATLSQGELNTLRAEYDAGVAAGTIQAAAAPGNPPATTATTTAPASTTPAASGNTPPANAIEAQLAEQRTAFANEHRRVAKINELTASHPEIGANAIEAGWSIEKTELEVLRASRPTNVPNGIVRSAGQPTNAVLEAAICQAAGLAAIDKHFDAQTLQAAYDAHRGQIGLQEVLLLAAQDHGFQGRGFRGDHEGVLRAAFGVKASFSTLSLPGILSNVANKFLLQGWNSVETAWREIAATRPVRDFKAITSYRLTGDMTYAEVGPDGELTHGTVGEASFTNQAKTYGRMFAVTRQDQINDDLGALTQLPQRIGRGGALAFNNIFWAAFMDNATFFASGNANYSTGAATALGVDAYTAAEKLFFDQTDPDGEPIALSPAVLLVPNGLNVTAQQLMSSMEMRDTTATTKSLTKNPHAGKAKVVRSAYLSNAAFTGYSALAWYLLANPLDMPVIEAVFLNGKQEPTVETAQADFNVLGIQMRGYHDFGVALQEHRAGVKFKGEA